MASTSSGTRLRLIAFGIIVAAGTIIVGLIFKGPAPGDSALPAPPTIENTVAHKPVDPPEQSTQPVLRTPTVPEIRRSPGGLPSLGDPPKRRIEGVIREKKTGFPVGARIQVLESDGDPCHFMETRLGGLFSGKIPNRGTTLQVTAKGRLDLEVTHTPLPPSEGNHRLDILLPTAGNSIVACVADEYGTAVRGVEVRLLANRAHRTTSMNGCVSFRPIRDGTYTVSVPTLTFSGQNNHLATVTVKDGKQLVPLNFTISRGSSITGTVRDANLKLPVENAIIVVSPQGSRQEHDRSVTRKDGSFSISRLVPGSYVLTLTTGSGEYGRTHVLVENIEANEDRAVSVEMYPEAGTVTGKVITSEGRPVPFAELEAIRSGPASLEPILTRTDSRGRFRVESLPIGTWSFGASRRYCDSNNWVPDGGTSITLDRGAEEVITLTLERGIFVEGRVVQLTERDGLIVRLRENNGEFVEETLSREGLFTFGGIRPGNYYIEVLDPSESTGTALAQQIVYIQSGRRTSIRLEVP